MSLSASNTHAFCARQDRHVSLDQTEGECREQHRCSDEACPLESKFGADRFARSLELMAASIGQPLLRMR